MHTVGQVIAGTTLTALLSPSVSQARPIALSAVEIEQASA